MQLSAEDVDHLKRLARAEVGAAVRLRLFGSRVDDNARGGDVDLLLELDNPVTTPAQLVARLSARASRALGGRRVDVLLSAPNLKRLPIHIQALRHGVEL